MDNLLFTQELAYLKDLNEHIIPRFQSTSIISQYNAIKSGLGVGILPCFLADNDPSLVKILPNEITITRSFWLVTHPEIKRLSRVETVWQYLKSLTENDQELLNPKR